MLLNQLVDNNHFYFLFLIKTLCNQISFIDPRWVCKLWKYNTFFNIIIHLFIIRRYFEIIFKCSALIQLKLIDQFLTYSFVVQITSALIPIYFNLLITSWSQISLVGAFFGKCMKFFLCLLDLLAFDSRLLLLLNDCANLLLFFNLN